MNELPVTAQSAKGLPRPLAERSAIDPFIVMDVMGEANARELSGDDIIHMEVGQPASPAPKAARSPAGLKGNRKRTRRASLTSNAATTLGGAAVQPDLDLC
jgi:aspartate/methionine/tyrosine aminotransferase